MALPELLGGFLGATPGRYAGAEDVVGTVTLAVPGTEGRHVPSPTADVLPNHLRDECRTRGKPSGGQ